MKILSIAEGVDEETLNKLMLELAELQRKFIK